MTDQNLTNQGLDGKIAVVTGAARGIGLGVAKALGSAGALVVAVDVDESALESATLPESAHKLVWDVAADPNGLAASIESRFGTPSVLFNNIAKMDGRAFLELPDDAVAQALRTNILSQWLLTRRVVDSMIKSNIKGSIIFNLSLHTSRVRMCPDYSISKAAMLMLVQELSFELGPHGIRVNGVSPGAIYTWSDKVPDADEHRTRSEGLIPLGRLGLASDVGSMVVFLADESKAGYITGADIRIDGGLNQFNWLHHLYGSAEAEQARVAPEPSD